MSSENPPVSRSSYNIPVVGVPTSESAELLNPSAHPLLDEYEPAFRSIVLSGLAAIQWAGRQNHDLLAVSPLNDVSYPPLHPDFVRQAATLNKEEALAAQAGAAVLAVTSAYQTWMHATNTGVRTISPKYQQYETSIDQEIGAPEAQWTAGDILYHPGLNWEVTDLSVQHAVNSGMTGAIRLSATVSRAPEGAASGSEPPVPKTKQYYFLNLRTSFNGTAVAGRPGWATGQVEAGMIDHERFATVDDGAGFERLVKFAQVLNSLVIGEARPADTPVGGYTFNLGRASP